MTLQQLIYYHTVVETLNISKAARLLHVSPQAVSFYIAKLEREYNTKFFDRTPRLSLTYAGEQFYFYSKKIVEGKKRLDCQMADIISQENCKITIGASPTLGRIFLPKILSVFIEEHPKYKIELAIEKDAVIKKRLLDGTIDIAICTSIPYDSNLIMEPIIQQRMHFAVSLKIIKKIFREDTDKMIEKFSKGIDLNYFLAEKFILPPKETLLRNIVDLYAYKKNFNLNIMFDTDDLGIRLTFACYGIALTVILNSINLNNKKIYSENGEIVYFFPPLENIALLDEHINITLMYQKNKYLNIATRNFIKTAKDVFNKDNNTLYEPKV